MRKAFTLIELLTVIAIMGMLGVAATGGYKALVTGMQERGVCAAASGALRAAKERAQMDRVFTVVYCYNKCLKVPSPNNEDDTGIVAGFLTAIRLGGRITYVDGNLLYDEFGDLNLCYPCTAKKSGGDQQAGSHRLFKYNGGETADMQYSLVSDVVYGDSSLLQVDFFTGGRTNIVAGAFRITDFQDKAVKQPTWTIGDGYAFEFLELQLPDGFIFEGSVPSMQAGAIGSLQKIVFDPDEDSNKTLTIYSTTPNAQGVPQRNRKAGEAKADGKKNV